MKFKIRLILTLVFFQIATFLNGQVVDKKCGTNAYTAYKEAKDSNYVNRLNHSNRLLNEFIQRKQLSFGKSNNSTTIKIPVVVHVVYKTSAQNISDEQILSQIKVMNEDFRRLNPDTLNTPEIWKTIAADAHIEFCMATLDPKGSPSTGIVRRPTKINAFNTDDRVKFINQGGDDAWDTKRYLNIWVCNLTGGLLGYGEFPTEQYSSTFGLVVAYSAFGTVGNVSSSTKRGRTTIHEISHCFNLRHIWADDGGGCTYDDGVDDTPKQGGPSSGCPKFPFKDACQVDSPGIMFMNYLDYSNDACMNMFTNGQSIRMRAALELFYPDLSSALLCDTPTMFSYDVAIESIFNPVGDICSDSISPVFVIRNTGIDSVQNVGIGWQFDNQGWQYFNWVGNLNSMQETIISMPPTYGLKEGGHSFSVFISSLNSKKSFIAFNDSLSMNFNVNTNANILPYSQSFESSPFPGDTKIRIINSGGEAWKKVTKAATDGIASIAIDNKLNDHEGDIDAFLLPNINLASFSGIPYLKFKWAYARKDNTTSDALQVLISTDCGYSFNILFNRSSAGLVTGSNQSVDFIPVASEWKDAIINLNAYKGFSNVIISFQNIAGGNGNNLYVDNINIGDKLTSLSSISAIDSKFAIYPNPANNELYLQSGFEESTEFTIFDYIGKIIKLGKLNAYQNVIDITEVPQGLYIIEFKNANSISITSRFIKL